MGVIDIIIALGLLTAPINIVVLLVAYQRRRLRRGQRHATGTAPAVPRPGFAKGSLVGASTAASRS